MATRKQKYTDDHKSRSEDRLSKDDQRQFWKLIFTSQAVAFSFMALVTYLSYAGFICLSGKVNTQFWDGSYYHRLEFAMRYQIIGIAWLLFCHFNVVVKRVTTKAINPLAGHEHVVFEANKILTNSFEQFLLSFFAQIISLSYLDEQTLLKCIPIINLFFGVGRVAFFFGYPKYRTFGYMLTAAPTTILILYNTFMFGKYVFC